MSKVRYSNRHATKTELKVRAHPMVEEISDERNSDSGIWAYLKPGFHTGEYEGHDRLHQVHEDTWTDVLAGLRDCKPCDCPECLKLLAKKTVS